MLNTEIYPLIIFVLLLILIALYIPLNRVLRSLFNRLIEIDKNWGLIFAKTTFLYKLEEYLYRGAVNRPGSRNPSIVLLLINRREISEKYKDSIVDSFFKKIMSLVMCYVLIIVIIIILLIVI